MQFAPGPIRKVGWGGGGGGGAVRFRSDTKSGLGGGGGGVQFASGPIRKVGWGGGGGAVRFRSDTKSGLGGGGVDGFHRPTSPPLNEVYLLHSLLSSPSPHLACSSSPLPFSSLLLFPFSSSLLYTSLYPTSPPLLPSLLQLLFALTQLDTRDTVWP